ncbi:MAG: sigma-70 family RNA polymerase sigma factor [Clostridia bacterium]|nr:sigma-70 family RNA polymerase sigma factor [Clostridia bacterium]NCC75195.1 sigma-70 family RNA polymerase sigma factor [Clostridia bacterium]
MSQDAATEQFELLYHQTFRRLSQYVLFKAGNISDTEDIVAAVYVDYFQHIVQRGHAEPDNPYAYLVRMANHGLGRLYKERQALISFDDEQNHLSETLPDDPESLHRFFDQIDSQELWLGIRRLTTAQQQVIVAHLRFDLTFREIAEQLGQRESAVKLRYYRALERLKKMFT